jgi:hypothetical protein
MHNARLVSSRSREDKSVALSTHKTPRTVRVKAELTILENNNRCVAALWQTMPEQSDLSKSQVSSKTSYVDICHDRDREHIQPP